MFATRMLTPFTDKKVWSSVCMRTSFGLLAGLLLAQDASAVFTFSAYTPVRQITMRVGSAGGTVNNVTFNVTGANISPTPVAVTGVPGGGAPVTSPVGGTEVTLTAGLVSPGGQRVTLTVDSSAGMTCVGGTGCGTTIIPFTTVSWTAFNHDVTYPTFDIQNGTFTGATNQTLTNYTVSGGSVTMSNVLIYQYSNATIYPSGQYTGRVIYTATIP
jgi:hypothetical protein